MSTWTELREYFEEDDGSLPDIEISFGTEEETRRAFDVLRKKAEADVSNGGPRTEVKGEAYHILLGGVTQSGVKLPDLGVLLAPPDMVLDYRMGADWNEEKVWAFLQLLNELCSHGGKVKVIESPEANTRFQAAMDRIKAKAHKK